MSQQQHASRWSLAHTGNRVFLAVLIGLLVSCLCGAADVPTAIQVLGLLAAGGLTYVAVTLLHRSRR